MILEPWMFFAFLGVVLLFLGGIGFFLFTLSRGGQRLFNTDEKIFDGKILDQFKKKDKE